MSDNLLVQTLLIFVVSFISYMHSYWGSTMTNRPIVVAPLVGLVLGDLETGIMVGATLELIFLGAVPIGASNPPNMTAGAIIGTSFVILTDASIGASVALAVPVATLVLLMDNLQMMFTLTWASHLADKYAAQGDYKKVERIVIFASLSNKFVLALICTIGFYVGVPVIESVLATIPKFIIDGMDVAAGMLPAIGFAMLARMLVTKELSPFLLIGFLLAAYLNMPVFGVALCGVAVGGVIFFSSKKIVEVAVDENEF